MLNAKLVGLIKASNANWHLFSATQRSSGGHSSKRSERNQKVDLPLRVTVINRQPLRLLEF
jgi:hypothetical protein